MDSCKVVQTFKFVPKIPWCDHSNEISLAVLSHCLSAVKKKIVNLLKVDFGHFCKQKG